MTRSERKLLLKLAQTIAAWGSAQEKAAITDMADKVEVQAMFVESDVPRYADGQPLDGEEI